MNFLIAGLGANVTLGLISGVTSATNGVYTLANRISLSTSTGANEIKQTIKETDLEMRIRLMQFLLNEICVDDKSPITLHVCLKGIDNVIKDIAEELEKIHYRMQYNDNLWMGASFRAYGFTNCHLRLKALIATLENRRTMLVDILSIKNKMYRSKELESTLSESVMMFKGTINTENAKKIRDDIHKKLDFIKE